MVTRRDFLKKAGFAAAATALLPSIEFRPATKRTGLILYTVRDDMAKDIDGTLKVIARLGYDWIEAADYSNGLFYGMKPAILHKKVESFGLHLISSHNGDLNISNIDKVIDDASEARLKFLILPSLPGDYGKSLDGYKQAADFFNVAGEKCKKAGMKFGFHNHTDEFKPIDNQIPYDILLKNTDPKLVTFELDLCWITASGNSAIEYFNKFPGRFELWHVKDMSPEKQDATLGEGMIDFKPVFALAKKSGLKYWFIEQDECKTHTTLESAKISRDYLLENIL
jgi:sugar phosphate isomerase/epimerase